MRRTLHFLNKSYRVFFRHWKLYLLLVIGTNFILSQVIQPILTVIVNTILSSNHVEYLTYTNIISVIVNRPILLIELILVILAILGIVYVQMAFMIRSIRSIRYDLKIGYKVLLKQSIHDVLALRPLTALLVTWYFVLILPFGEVLFKSSLLSKVTIPDFIIQDMWASPTIWGPILIVYGLAFFFSIRLISFLPTLLFSSEKRTGQLIKLSWDSARGRFWTTLLKGLVITTSLAILAAISQIGLYAIQSYADTHLQGQALVIAMVNLLLLEFFSQVVLALSVVLLLGIALDIFEQHQPQLQPVQEIHTKSKRMIGLRRAGVTLAILLIAGTVSIYNYGYLKGLLGDYPVLISHRGVDDGNGVQNTIPALEKTSAEKPDYIEMDIQETKDHQFVVMHDPNLEALAGVNRTVHDLTLSELTALTVSENGYSAKIPSFDQYLDAAEKHHQKLLVEIKVSPQDSPNMTKNFVKKYQKRMLADKNRIHSLSYDVVSQVKKQAPNLYVSFIMPYNISFPNTPANAYTMEATTLNDTFVSQAHDKKQDVYAWTVNDDSVMQNMMFMDVDGIITDQLSTLKDVVKANNDHPSYANRLSLFSNQLSGFDVTVEN
ncbi:glycerophosphoryl diester phosphodiesterase membrane domain-containing protein [Dellaglioa algida]|uniref:Glycerophosphoryl diester phosphodiesterase n=1 Tax=Dellaglioa algida TaxID=105612 RepID=A0A5C6MAS4_9LACO|nr:glycerophosphodiester phosphodiesterase [Dellaglioa algida]MDK1716133.1 glycerophosphodiester phosphodiesterase [Dellaglioa algida]MDK1719414.1 glycerophosphodiester phosphodiesterase [Dellaglioa algida]MDK1721084.1 glycerophosphodiester phosphodiesterase [Dellaglioa algida]MDK1722757.1 glycerophosphodiester phosphodiesterase [Dellaglioa algida]MDK1724376.1 glycerophosphodiester phosphodiesterase [Dellaglioa algida]